MKKLIKKNPHKNNKRCYTRINMALRLPKRWLRQITYLAISLSFMGVLIAVVDLMYKNILPSPIHNMIPYQGKDTILQKILIKDCSVLNKNCQVDGFQKYRVDLQLGKSWTKSTFLFTKIVTEEQLLTSEDSKVIIDIVVSNETTTTPVEILSDIGSVNLKDSGWRYYDYGIWLKYGEFVKGNVINEIDVLFGPDAVDPRGPKWKLLKDQPLLLQATPGLEPYLSYRKGQVPELVKPLLKINKDSKFKILQVADLHFSTGVGKCRDPFPETSGENCEADPRTIQFINKVLDLENPDMVVLSGDQIFGEDSPDSKTTLFKALSVFIERKIPYAITLGNHDDEGSMDRAEVMLWSCQLPYSVASMGPEDIDGVGNYLLNVELHHSKNPLMSLWFLDTHKYSQSPKTNPGYDWIKESQLNWIRSQYKGIEQERSSYTHIHLSMAFFHIPLPEYRDMENHVMVGSFKEGVTAPNYNTGAHDLLRDIGVSVLSVGHDHCNDYCLLNDFWMCYGGAVGEGGYAGYGGTSRRLRVFEIDTQRNDIRSWKRLENDPTVVIDSQVLVSGGKVVEV